jgi:glycogen debranching enzyme
MTAADRILVHRGTFAAIAGGGDITGGRGTSPDGLFVRDVRHLSRWRLTAGAGSLTVLGEDGDGIALVPPGTRDEPPGWTVLRQQAVTEGAMAEHITVLNNSARPAEAVLELTVDADFADQFELRTDRRTYDKPGARRGVTERPDGVVLHYERDPDWTASTTVTADPAPDTIRVPWEVPDQVATGAGGTPDGVHPGGAAAGGTARTLCWRLALPPHGRTGLALTARAVAAPADRPAPVSAAPGAGSVAALVAAQTAETLAFTDASPRPAELTGWRDLAAAVRQGMADLAGLRVPARGADGEDLLVPGAGIPWFLTLFGRDSLLTSLFCLPYRPGPAAATLSALAAAQGTVYDTSRLEQPGRIPHELRHGELAHFGQVPYGRYYGSVDATPLFLVLLGAYTDTTGDTGPARRLERHARAAVDWMFRDGGLDERGWLVYTSDEASGGLANQNWKDSAGAVCFPDGTQATGAIAVVEAQGYAYDALRRTARLSTAVWQDDALSRRLDAAAEDLRRRFISAFWPAGAGFPALALDGEGRRADTLASDAGHLLWSGILDEDRGRQVGRRLLAGDFFSGWGIRTLAAGQVPYHPLSYHRGAVWPHDNAVIALGLARYGLDEEARTVARALLQAARHRRWRLPEVIAGYGTTDHPRPLPYPRSCSPQAWAAATPMALLTAVHRQHAHGARRSTPAHLDTPRPSPRATT